MMSDSVGWIGVVLALIALSERVYDKFNTRAAAKEKAEADRLAALDKMQFDAEFLKTKNEVVSLKADQHKCQEESAVLKARVAELEEKAAGLEVKAAGLERRDDKDKRELEAKIASLKSAMPDGGGG